MIAYALALPRLGFVIVDGGRRGAAHLAARHQAARGRAAGIAIAVGIYVIFHWSSA